MEVWYFWCLQRSFNPIYASEFLIVRYPDSLHSDNKPYSVLNTHKSMLLQTLPFLHPMNDWCNNCPIISRYMKGVFISAPPKPRYVFTWDVSVVFNYLKTLYPVESLSLKHLTFKTNAFITLASAPRAQTLVSIDLNYMTKTCNCISSCFPNIPKNISCWTS